jgi:hypothetical protein
MTYEPQDVGESPWPLSRAVELLPSREDIPDEFMRYGWNDWTRLAQRWWSDGLRGHFVPKEGIDCSKALRHLDICLRSCQPKHEHKIGGVGYLMSLWFERYEDGEKSCPTTA